VAIWVAIQGSTQLCSAAAGQLKKIAVPMRETLGQLHFSRRVDMRRGDGVSAEALMSSHIYVHFARPLVRRGTSRGVQIFAGQQM
jgi:hypothetical protein